MRLFVVVLWPTIHVLLYISFISLPFITSLRSFAQQQMTHNKFSIRNFPFPLPRSQISRSALFEHFSVLHVFLFIPPIFHPLTTLPSPGRVTSYSTLFHNSTLAPFRIWHSPYLSIFFFSSFIARHLLCRFAFLQASINSYHLTTIFFLLLSHTSI